MKIGVVDYEAGNLKSVMSALSYLGADFFVSRNPGELENADKLIFPGVGEANQAMSALHRFGLDSFMTAFAGSGRPLLGICIGCQIIMNHSEENDTSCLGLVSGDVRKFEKVPGLKVPHMGWNQVFHQGHLLFSDIPDGASFYFVHSFYPVPAKGISVIGRTDYGITFASAIAADAVYAVQFHPEKSGPAGLRLLNNFIEKL